MTAFNEKWQKCRKEKKTKKQAFGKTAEYELQRSQKHYFTASHQTKTHWRAFYTAELKLTHSSEG